MTAFGKKDTVRKDVVMKDGVRKEVDRRLSNPF
jgi:hypothetical protein